MKRLLLDLVFFAALASAASCVTLSFAAPAPLEKKARPTPGLLARVRLDYGTATWEVTLYRDGSYRASRPDSTTWLGTWSEIESGTFEIHEAPQGQTRYLRWRATEYQPGCWKQK